MEHTRCVCARGLNSRGRLLGTPSRGGHDVAQLMGFDSIIHEEIERKTKFPPLIFSTGAASFLYAHCVL